eukprot:1161167-Pelagomonas_calceolata.AAC.2
MLPECLRELIGVHREQGQALLQALVLQGDKVKVTKPQGKSYQSKCSTARPDKEEETHWFEVAGSPLHREAQPGGLQGFTNRSHQAKRMTARLERKEEFEHKKYKFWNNAALQEKREIKARSRKHQEKKRKTMQAVKTLLTSMKEKRILRAEAPCIPFTKRNKAEFNGNREGY